jgi:hypothetical protein
LAVKRVYAFPNGPAVSLVGELARRPSTTKVVPQEDQLTIVLGWLCDRSELIARGVAGAFLKGDRAGLKALDATHSLRAQVQVALPALGRGGPLRADLSISGSDQRLQLLVEVKLGSDFQAYPIARVKVVSQPDAYVAAWAQCDPDGEARVRRVGTLRLDGDAPPRVQRAGEAARRGQPLRAKDLRWDEIHALLGGWLASKELASEVRAVAADLHEHLGARVIKPRPASEELMQWGVDYCRALAKRLTDDVSGARLGSFRLNRENEYAGGYLNGVRGPHETTAQFWIVLTPKATSYNVPGWPDVVQLALMQGYNADSEQSLLAAGFEDAIDRKGYRLLRVALPLEDLDEADDFEVELETGAAWVIDLLRTAGWLAAERGTVKRRRPTRL